MSILDRNGRAERDATFEAFAAAAVPSLHRSAWLLCRHDHEADDLVQETLAKVYVAWHGRRRIDNPIAYAHTALTRTFISARRKRSSRDELPHGEVPELGQADGADEVVVRLSLRTALAALAPLDRAVVVLRHWEGRDVRETARLLSLSEGAVRNRCMRALSHLRDVLDDSGFASANAATTGGPHDV